MRKLLLIDDSPEITTLVKMALEIGGWSLEVANTAADGVQLVRAESFDLVLLDNELPDGRGLDVLEQIRAVPDLKKLPVVLFSGSTRIDPGYQSLGLSGNIPKPFDVFNLAEEICRIAGWES